MRPSKVVKGEMECEPFLYIKDFLTPEPVRWVFAW
jgi:hypothetical protein